MSTASDYKPPTVHDLVNRMSMSQDQVSKPANKVSVRNGPEKRRICKARYSYLAEQEDELTFDAGETIEVLEEIEEGWMKGIMQSNKKTGLFPTNFVNFLPDGEAEKNGNKLKSLPSSVASTPVKATPAVANPEKKDEKRVDQSSSINTRPASSRRGASTSSIDISDTSLLESHYERANVLYSYEKTQDDELSLIEGTTIRILDKHSQDDGWYFGEYEDKRGVFPSNFVKIISKSSETPPTPPPVKSKPSMSSVDEPKHVVEKPMKESPLKPLGFDTKSSEPPAKNPSSNNFVKERSSLSTRGISNESKVPGPNETLLNNSVSSGNKIRDLQKSLFENRLPPKPGDKPARPLTTIGDITAPTDSDVEKEKETNQIDSKMSHPQRDRPKQNKRPPSMMPVVVDNVSSSSVTTSFSVKDDLPITHKPAVIIAKKVETEIVKEKHAFNVSRTEATISPAKKSHTPSVPVSTGVAALPSQMHPMLPRVDDGMHVTGKDLNHVIDYCNNLAKALNRLTQQVNQSAC